MEEVYEVEEVYESKYGILVERATSDKGWVVWDESTWENKFVPDKRAIDYLGLSSAGKRMADAVRELSVTKYRRDKVKDYITPNMQSVVDKTVESIYDKLDQSLREGGYSVG